MDGRVGLGREERARLDGSGSGVRERKGGRAGWMGEWSEGERRRQGWMREWASGLQGCVATGLHGCRASELRDSVITMT